MESTKSSIIMTGANGDLSCAIVRRIMTAPELVRYHSVYLVRDASWAAALRSALAIAPTSHSYEVVSLELCRLGDVREVARGLKTRIATGEIPPIRTLLLVAGYTDAGLQLWTMMLLESMDREVGRIIILGSSSYA